MKKTNFIYFLLAMVVIGIGSRGVFARHGSLSITTFEDAVSEGDYNTELEIKKIVQLMGAPILFDSLKSTNNNNQLTAAMWDGLIDKLQRMQSNMQKIGGSEIPAGAIMAFDLTSCPKGRLRRSKANGRFLRGAGADGRKGDIGTIGGNDSIQLTEGQLPPHSHYLFGKIDKHDDLADLVQYPETAPIWQYTRGYFGNGDDRYVMRSIWTEASVGKTSSVGNGESINILNPYVNVIYCKKI